MAATLGAPKVLLRRLREIMAHSESGEERLKKIVVEIAAIIVAEVCSIYLRRRDESMELVATEGLNPEAVHKTHLARGEGLVGLVTETAEPVNLPEAQDHPAFSYHPETGEEIYHSFLGVPILQRGRAVGVLTVQNRAKRHYSDEEVEALQITAMVLAELATSGELGPARAERAQGRRMFSGVALSKGIALGHVVFHVPRVAVERLIADNPEEESRRLAEAVEQLRSTVDDMLARGDVARAGEHREVLGAYRMFAHDRGWLRRLNEAVATGLTAEAAVAKVQNETRARVVRQTAPYLRERFNDLDDLSNRLLRVLTGRTTASGEELPEDTILVARTMGPAELLDYDRDRLRGLILEEGGAASHVAIVARALDVPAIGQAGGILSFLEAGDPAIVDADAGEFHIRPSLDVVSVYKDKLRFKAQQQAQYAKLKDRPAVTTDGVEIELLMNAGLLVDLAHFRETGADGIGLFRTEFQFMVSATLPRLGEQQKMYEKVLREVDGKPVVFRSLDVGGDKALPYLRSNPEENPALGWRAIRMALDRPALLRTQVRALMRASAGREMRIMLPMVSDVGELKAARALIDLEIRHMERHGHPMPERLLLGTMIEVPALLWQLDQLFPLVDFASVGSNDLLQFLYAADRSNMHVAQRFDPLSPATLRMLGEIVAKARRHKTPLTLCGEMAGDPLGAMALVALGFRSISMAPASLGPVKAMLRSLNAGAANKKLLGAIAEETGSVRDQLEAFAADTGVEI
ncbi:phosphoenolpyruvate-protein phosphotransferase [bacterium BMS3Bbin10]|nr:phosphoenolpyruvate-protein phosphotransferase [bacterium BMS3Bbin10]